VSTTPPSAKPGEAQSASPFDPNALQQLMFAFLEAAGFCDVALHALPVGGSSVVAARRPR
jgi:hypothetical protein